ncbi:sensor histidine kinase [Amycolatopsis granulosa]|uniref:sensor histidine kinase n=1 Tax=Amycolatopsis granulosa TaxID=185684 RepID=UPI00142308F3|nr:histidine kinase [Amycolatopsis granulosa]NIH86041.1 signal transduction histidine kinase [Amycolatopsis granulosa]
MNTTTGIIRRGGLDMGWPVPVLGALCAVLVAMPVASAPETVSALSVLLAAMGTVLYRRRPPLVIVAASVAASAISVLVTVACGGRAEEGAAAWLLLETVFLLCLLVQSVRRLRIALVLPAAGMLVSAVVLAPLRLGAAARASPAAASVLAWSFGCGLLAACAVAIGLYLRSLDEAREESARAARREQSLQLARELHDWLGHEVTGLVLEAQAARLAGRPAGEVEHALRRIEEAGVRVLDCVDNALCWLRAGGEVAATTGGGRSMAITDLPALVRRFEGLGSIGVVLNLDERAREVGPDVAATVYRVVLEALTNVRRHAPAAREVSVEVRRNAGHLIVRVVNDGVRRQGLLKRGRAGGSGLDALMQRVAALGGKSWAGRVGSAGWAVHVVVPVAV